MSCLGDEGGERIGGLRDMVKVCRNTGQENKTGQWRDGEMSQGAFLQRHVIFRHSCVQDGK